MFQLMFNFFYQGYILPLIDYGSMIWENTSSSNLDRISKLQKRAARIILHANFNTPSAEMLKELRWLPIVKRLKYNKAVFTYKAVKKLTPQYIKDLLKPVAETHNRALPSSVNGALAVPRSRFSLFDRSYSYTAPKLWNSIPIPICDKFQKHDQLVRCQCRLLASNRLTAKVAIWFDQVIYVTLICGISTVTIEIT